MNKLTARGVDNLNEQGMYADGNGLYLKVTKTGSKSWVHRYQINGRRRDMGLGNLKDTSLKEAREAVGDNRKLIRKRLDPIDQRTPSDAIPTFNECATRVIASKKSEWSNPKSAQQWKNSLKNYASPFIGKTPVDQITTDSVMKVLTPIWNTKTETASRVRNRIEIILDWAKVKKYRKGENPAMWRGQLEHLLPKPSKVQKVQHYSAMPYEEISDFMAELHTKTTISAKALQFTILTACRTSEAIGASWDEIDMDKRLWTIPAERMKMDKPHTGTLSKQDMSLIKSLPSTEGWLFPSPHYDKHISNSAMLVLLKRYMGHPKLTIHGFRSSFRDWTAEETSTPNIVAEMALAHGISSETEKSYRRGDLLAKRRTLMDMWGNYCDKTSNVIPFKKSAS